ncbi:acetyl-CoA carboxylase biotin carboxyl carrier protein [Coxiella endosymbiont of Amblyomma sculptum]|uniref:acetyl-CoA carboxylase biotin carboxyl carrier protein n=1 Tax=Coxiella endosymbiont of Amblyomma sculptum TaxID=2487929 RepID=UPI00132E7B73|nr:acetyl-CoA carboxylase biotin carboxyl carrier protein [Coxiella endosymbiont of Amblyomma sculptum]QHG92252.1 acetyl-CoA carboxylase biotin carboxyl carrier protein [Coxiella endosymbiont of Amblyomma sculptum]
MDICEIKRLVKLINGTRIKEIEIKSSKGLIRISQFPQDGISISHPVSTVVTNSPESSSIPNQTTPNLKKSSDSEISNSFSLKSPMVGTVYLSPTPKTQPFVEIGQQISVGDIICIIEAMKIFNKIEADKNGVVTACLVEDGQPVEFNQPLFLLKKD